MLGIGHLSTKKGKPKKENYFFLFFFYIFFLLTAFHRKESSDSVRALLMEGADPGLKNAKGIQYVDDLKLCIILLNGINVC